MAPIATADGLASLDCNDSGLSYAANIAGLLTFVAAIVLSFRLSMRTTRGIYDALEQMSIKHALNHEDRRMHDRLDTLNMIRQKYGPMMPIRIREWAFRDRLKHWDERYHTLYERVRSVLFCKLNVHKPVLWMWRSGDGWAGKELEKIQMDGEKLLAELRGFNEDLVHKVEQSTHDLLNTRAEPPNFEQRVLAELSWLRDIVTSTAHKVAALERASNIERADSGLLQGITVHPPVIPEYQATTKSARPTLTKSLVNLVRAARPDEVDGLGIVVGKMARNPAL